MINDLASNSTEIKGWPGLWVTELWTTNETADDNQGMTDRGARPMRHDPVPNGTIFRVVEIPPESKTQGIDAKVAFEHLGQREQAARGGFSTSTRPCTRRSRSTIS